MESKHKIRWTWLDLHPTFQKPFRKVSINLSCFQGEQGRFRLRPLKGETREKEGSRWKGYGTQAPPGPRERRFWLIGFIKSTTHTTQPHIQTIMYVYTHSHMKALVSP